MDMWVSYKPPNPNPNPGSNPNQVATRALSRDVPSVLALLGTGPQARAQP